MASTAFSIAGGLRHRLSRIYQDTKNLYEFIEPPKVSGAEELSSLHRKLRIQKDRLITWGLQWSDKGGEDIDESLDKAGLGDVVGSVLATIKEIIAEADPLWQSSRALMTGSDEKLSARMGGEKALERKASFVQWDRARFEGLVGDLTVSIDTLYDISKNRQRTPRLNPDAKRRTVASSSSMEKIRTPQFESSRMQTPQQIDPSILIHPGDLSGTLLKPSRAAIHQVPETRQIVYMRRQHTSNNPWKRDGGILAVPVLLEYAQFDPIFASTGISPPMDRFEKLFAGLQSSQNSSRQELNVPKLIGYFEDLDGARFGLIYELPKQFGAFDGLDNDGNSSLPMISTVSDLLRFNRSPPALEGKFRLAYNLANTVFKLSAKEIVHGDVASDNVLFFHKRTPHPTLSSQDYDIRQPFLTNFDLFSATGGLCSYAKHIEAQYWSHSSPEENFKAMDLRGLALLLLEIGLWVPLGEILAQSRNASPSEKEKLTDADFLDSSEICTRLAGQCGTLYRKAVQTCWQAGDLEIAFSKQRDPGQQVKIYWKVVKALEKCCVIDEDSELEEVDFDTLPTENTISSIGQPTAGPVRRKSNHQAGSDSDRPAMTRFYKRSARYQHKSDMKLPEIRPDSEKEVGDTGKFQVSSASIVAPRDYNTPVEVVKPAPDSKPEEELESFNKRVHEIRLSMSTDEKQQESPFKTDRSAPRLDEKYGLHGFPAAPNLEAPTKAVIPASNNKRKLRLFATNNITQQHWDDWHSVLMPRINHLLRGFYRKHPESVEISLVSMGETPQKTRPTILAICTSVNQVKSILKKSFSYDKSIYDLKVCKGKILRSRRNRPPSRSMADPLNIEEPPAANTEHQMYPRFGASIGAYVEGRNLPPVSLGGILEIDGVVYGMSVHHMLDEDDDLSDVDHDEVRNPHRSSGYSAASDSEGDFYYSSDDVMQSGTELESEDEYETEDEDMTNSSSLLLEPGDKEGIPVDCGDGYYVTQPAIDDVDEEFFPSPDDKDEEHVESHRLGEVYASSGIRRTSSNGQVHEIDWALFTFSQERLPPPTLPQEGQTRFCKNKSPASYPSGIVPCSELQDLQVHCMGRSSGLRAGKISSGMTSLKVYGRKTPSQSYEVRDFERQGNMLGIPGDSGAWVIDNETGRICGSVLAWSSRKKVAYICPMDVLVRDIARTVDAKRVCLSSGKVVVAQWRGSTSLVGSARMASISEKHMDRQVPRGTNDSDDSDDSDDDADDEDEDDEDVETRTVRNVSPGFKLSSPTLPTAPIRIGNNNPRHSQQEFPDLIPAMDKMRISTDVTSLHSSKRISMPIAGSVK